MKTCHAKKKIHEDNGRLVIIPHPPTVIRHCRFYLRRVDKYDRRD